jgi:hypothetical protein
MAGPSFEPAPVNSSPLVVTYDVQPDLIAVLSNAPRAAERLLDLRQRSADANSLIPKHAQMSEVTTAKIQAEARLSRLTEHPSRSGFGLGESDPRVVAASKAVEAATAAVERLQKREAETSANWRAVGRVLQSVEAWLRDRPGGTVLEDFAGPPASLPKNESLVDAIARDQQRIDQLKAKLDGIRRSGFPASDCKRAMREHITALSERGRPDVVPLVKRDDDVAFVHERTQVAIYNATQPLIGFGSMPDVLGLLAWLCKDQIVAKLDGLIDEACADDKGMTHADRERAEAGVMQDLLSVERHQSDLIWRAQAEGLPISHRPDCDPKVILGIRLVTQPRQPSGSTGAHAYDVVGVGGR